MTPRRRRRQGRTSETFGGGWFYFTVSDEEAAGREKPIDQEILLKRVKAEISALMASAAKARKATEMDPLAITVKGSFPQLVTQSEFLVAADAAAAIRRYASTCGSLRTMTGGS